MEVVGTAIEDVRVIYPKVFADDRGFFLETYHMPRYAACGITDPFVQDNLSYSIKGALRGLHFQVRRPQGKLVQVISGRIFDVAVDIRPGSPTFGQWAGVLLSDENKGQIWIPKGFAHGFCVLSETAHVYYKCTDIYNPGDEGGILWSDPGIGIEWPVSDPVVSSKDKNHPRLLDLSPDRLFLPEAS